MATEQPITVGDLVDQLNKTFPVPINLPSEHRDRRIALPAVLISDRANSMFRIELEDGHFLNLHVKFQ